MIDWLWMRVGCAAAASLQSGRVMSLSPEGAIEWETLKWMQSRGSYDTTMAVRPRMACKHFRSGSIEISGSPAKYLQGHNLFGSDSPHLASEVISDVCSQLDITLTDEESIAVTCGYVQLLRVDVNYSYSTGSLSNVLAWTRAAEQHGYLEHRGRGMLKGSTVVWGSKSRHWQLKAYAKGEEIQAKNHQLAAGLIHRDLLTAWAADKLRIEVQFNARYLRDMHLDWVRRWRSDTPSVLHSQHLAKLKLTGEMRIPHAELQALPSRVRVMYAAWAAGEDLRSTLSDRTFYRYRKQLLAHGVDIAVACPDARRNVVPLIRYIEAKPVGIPDFAVGTPLYFEPSRLTA